VDRRRGERRGAARDVDADAVHRREEFARRAAFGRLHRPRLAQRRDGEAPDAAVRVLDRAHDPRVDRVLKRGEVGLDLQPAAGETFELRDVPAHGPVAFLPDGGEDFGGGALGGFGKRGTGVELLDRPLARLDYAYHDGA